jgi:hypothetical protein
MYNQFKIHDTQLYVKKCKHLQHLRNKVTKLNEKFYILYNVECNEAMEGDIRNFTLEKGG